MVAGSPTTLFAALVLLGVPALSNSPNQPGKPEVGSSEWFHTMRTADGNLAMLKALPGSNGQAVVPPDCVEVSAVFKLAAGYPHRKRMPHLRIVSTDDRIDNVPRSPYIYQTPGQDPDFYMVLKRELTYEFYWLDAATDERFAIWRVPSGAPKQLQLIFAIDARGSGRISIAAAERRHRR